MATTVETLRSAIADLPRPEMTVAIKPSIRTVVQAELALREIAWCNAVTAAVNAKAGELIADLQEATKAACSYEIPAGTVLISDRRQYLEVELLRWADENRANLCQGRKKSAKLVNGSISWRDGKDSVKRSEDVDAKSAKALVGELPIDEPIEVEAGPLVACLQRIVDAVGFHGAISVVLDVNKTAATAAFKLKQLTADQLESIGYEFAAGEEYVTVEPAEFVRSGS